MLNCTCRLSTAMHRRMGMTCGA